MFGISWAEFLVILLVAILVVPARMWPDVARFLARVVRFVREIIWKVTDASENLKQQIELEQPIDEIIQTTTDDVLDTISSVLPKKKKTRTRVVKKDRAK
jgi:Sec-independent protein translocase protein TatA